LRQLIDGWRQGALGPDEAVATLWGLLEARYKIRS
jgi:hypothetical protein